jgi:hypothetical protein
MILELEPVANDFIETKMQRDRPDLKIECTGYENVAISEIASGIDQCLRQRENRRLQRHLEKIIRKADQPVSVHAPVGAKGKDVELRTRIEIQTEKHGYADEHFRKLIHALHQ